MEEPVYPPFVGADPESKRAWREAWKEASAEVDAMSIEEVLDRLVADKE